MTKAENFEMLGKSQIQYAYAINESIVEKIDFNGDLEILKFEDGSRLNVQTWTEVNA